MERNGETMIKKQTFKILSIILILGLMIMPLVIAQQTYPKISGLTFFDKVSLFFKFNKEQKIIKLTQILDKRINEASIENTIENQEKISDVLDKVSIEINKGEIKSEIIRNKVFNKLNESKEKIDDLEKFPIIIPSPEKKISCGGFAGTKCPSEYRCTCDFSQDCKFDQIGTCVPNNSNKTQKTKDKIVCTMIYDPVCGDDGNTYPSECVAKQRGIIRVTKGECTEEEKKICNEVCLYSGTSNEGMYDSCSRELIVLKKCDFSSPIPKPDQEPNPKSGCNYDKDCQNNYRSCYFKCIKNICSEIMTFVKLPDYPNCEEIKPTPITTPEPIPLPPVIRDQCTEDKTCRNNLRNCNAICLNKQCTIVNSFKSMGTYPNCESYGVY